MELAYTTIFFIFMFNWFSRYNLITFILFVSTFNIIRNVRVHMVKNQIDDSPNPFLRVIKWSGDTLQWLGSITSSSGSGLADRFGFIKWIGTKYTELNGYFLELLAISKKQTMEQFALGFNYTLTNVLSLPGSGPGLNPKSIKTTNQEIHQLNKEYEKKNSLQIPLTGLINCVPLFTASLARTTDLNKAQILQSATQSIKTQEQINTISNIIKDLDQSSNVNTVVESNAAKRIDIYDSDDETININLKEKSE